LFGADSYQVVTEALGALRLKLGEDFNLLEGDWKPLWVVDFPMFEKIDDNLHALHHPFTAPRDSNLAALKASPETALSNAYDMVLNGVELGGGSVRIHDMEMQSLVFDLLGIEEQEAQEKFGFLLEALQYGNAGVLKRPESVLVVIYSQALNVLVLQRDDDAEFWQSVNLQQ